MKVGRNGILVGAQSRRQVLELSVGRVATSKKAGSDQFVTGHFQRKAPSQPASTANSVYYSPYWVLVCPLVIAGIHFSAKLGLLG